MLTKRWLPAAAAAQLVSAWPMAYWNVASVVGRTVPPRFVPVDAAPEVWRRYAPFLMARVDEATLLMPWVITATMRPAPVVFSCATPSGRTPWPVEIPVDGL